MKHKNKWFLPFRFEKGAVAVEFALLAPLLILILLLVIDFSRLGYVQISLNSAARESVRASSFGLSLADITNIANASSGGAARIAQISAGSTLTVNQVTSCSSSTTLGRTTEVQVSAVFDWVTPVELLNLAGGSGPSLQNLTLKARGVMVCAG